MSIDIEVLEQISKSLDQIAKIEAIKIIQSEEWVGKTNCEKIIFLYQLDFKNDDIATIVGTTPGTVQKEISTRKNN